MKARDAKALRTAALVTPSDLEPNAVRDISGALTALLADMFALYVKTKNFYWHVSVPHFRDYHLLLDEQADQIFAATDDIAVRVLKNRRNHAALDRPDWAVAAYARQRRRVRHAAGYAGGAA